MKRSQLVQVELKKTRLKMRKIMEHENDLKIKLSKYWDHKLCDRMENPFYLSTSAKTRGNVMLEEIELNLQVTYSGRTGRDLDELEDAGEFGTPDNYEIEILSWECGTKHTEFCRIIDRLVKEYEFDFEGTDEFIEIMSELPMIDVKCGSEPIDWEQTYTLKAWLDFSEIEPSDADEFGPDFYYIRENIDDPKKIGNLLQYKFVEQTNLSFNSSDSLYDFFFKTKEDFYLSCFVLYHCHHGEVRKNFTFNFFKYVREEK